ncbi:MAG: hypothetical protein K9H16_06500, partial [Bacteroidales bacterium]|nr:hypothetical protein [Bacteroidales bacterium]
IKSGEPGEFQIKISPNQARNLIRLLDTNFMDLWKQANTYQMSDEIEYFAKMVKEKGEALNIGLLISYGQNLGEAVDHFDLEKMDVYLKQFPAVIKNLKTILAEKT